MESHFTCLEAGVTSEAEGGLVVTSPAGQTLSTVPAGQRAHGIPMNDCFLFQINNAQNSGAVLLGFLHTLKIIVMNTACQKSGLYLLKKHIKVHYNHH